MKSIDDIVADFVSLPPVGDEQWHTLALVPGRLHLSRGPGGEFAIFIEGDAQSFGRLLPLPAIAHSDRVVALPTARTFAALRVMAFDAINGNRAVAHIAYELWRRLDEDPTQTNESLMRAVEWVLPLLGGRDALLSAERRTGLVGECLLLRKLLIHARRIGLGPGEVLRRWWGHYPARRDFAALGVAIAVKTTGQSTRVHHVGGIAQLEAQSPDERVYLYSVGIRTDISAPKKLPDFVADVEAQLMPVTGEDEAVRALFQDQLKRYGYLAEHAKFYRSDAGYLNPHLLPVLYDVRRLARLTLADFVGNQFPAEVAGVSYTLNVRSEPLRDEDAEVVFSQLLSSAEVSSIEAQ